MGSYPGSHLLNFSKFNVNFSMKENIVKKPTHICKTICKVWCLWSSQFILGKIKRRYLNIFSLWFLLHSQYYLDWILHENVEVVSSKFISIFSCITLFKVSQYIIHNIYLVITSYIIWEHAQEHVKLPKFAFLMWMT